MNFNSEYVLQLAILINQLEKKVTAIAQYDQRLKDLRKKYNTYISYILQHDPLFIFFVHEGLFLCNASIALLKRL